MSHEFKPARPSHPVATFFGTMFANLAARVIIGVLAIVIAVAVAEWKAADRKAKITETQRLLDVVAEEYGKELDEKGLFVRKEIHDVNDAWGQPCVIRYHTGVLNDDVAVISPGPDGKLGTWDDISIHRQTPLGKGQAAAKVVEKVVDIANATKKITTKK